MNVTYCYRTALAALRVTLSASAAPATFALLFLACYCTVNARKDGSSAPAMRATGVPEAPNRPGMDASFTAGSSTDGSVPEHNSRQLSPLDMGCLRQGRLALLRVLSSTPDCSGVGHLQIVLEVVEQGKTSAKRVHAQCNLGSCGFGPIAEPSEGSSSLLVASLRIQHTRAGTTQCVPLPATDAEVNCALPVATEAEGRALLSAAAQVDSASSVRR